MTKTELEAEMQKMGRQEAERTLKIEVGPHIKGKQYEDILEALRQFDLKHCQCIINLFAHAIYLPAIGGKKKRREPLEMSRLVTEIMKRLQAHLEDHNPYAEKYYQPRRFGMLWLGTHEKLFLDICNQVLQEGLSVELLKEEPIAAHD